MTDGGPAFPEPHKRGMSLRDYFAAKAMSALIINDEWDDRGNNEGGLAKVAYVIADAMLREREK